MAENELNAMSNQRCCNHIGDTLGHHHIPSFGAGIPGTILIVHSALARVRPRSRHAIRDAHLTDRRRARPFSEIQYEYFII
ncbi:hypothetical protein JI743_14725 [Sphingopyxis sp. DHUNG17]|nr:hypothetical protein [Sphingopyxis lutea]